MFLRSLIIAATFTLLSVSAAQAGWFDRDETPRAEEQKEAAKAKARKPVSSTSAYRAAMRTMHRDMKKPLSGNADVDFVRQMIPHHQGALAMARIQQKYGKDEELKKFNDWVIRAQSQEIALMQNWLRRKDNGKSCKKAEDYFGPAMQKMHHAMHVRYSGNADVDYVRGMIAHHQGAIDMAGVWFGEGSDPEIRTLAHDIFSSQTAEIAWMQRWLEERGQAYP